MLEIKNLTLKIKNQLILDGVSLSVKPQTITVIIGRNAAGKSTMLSCLNGERKYTGQISLCGKDLSLLKAREKARLFSLMPQHLPSPDITGEHLVRLGRTPYLDTGKHFTARDKEECKKAVSLTGAENLLSKKVSEMSGGEKQKIFLAMILAQDTDLIAFDEPASFMDIPHEREFYVLLTDTVQKHKKTALVVMHDLTRAVQLADNIAVMDNGKIVMYGSTDEVVRSGIIEKIFDVTRVELKGLTVYR